MANVEHFEIPVDNMDRAQSFYASLFGWHFESQQYGDFEYTFIQTSDSTKTLPGGMLKRQSPEQTITNYISVDSIETTCQELQELGGKVLMPKQEVKGAGFMAVCMDTENNAFGLWENLPPS